MDNQIHQPNQKGVSESKITFTQKESTKRFLSSDFVMAQSAIMEEVIMKLNLLKKAKTFIIGVLISTTLYAATASAADYTVLPNDSLYKIGLLFNTSVNILKTDNRLNSDIIYPGQVLNVSADMYTVNSGDSLFLIARKFNISLSSLRIANNKWDDMIFPGQKLLLPGSKPSTSTNVTSPSSKTVITYTQEEINLMARLITAEATGEPYDAMVAVGAVVVNRVQSNEWPSSINTVINQVIGEYHQFTPVKNGYINNPPSDDAIRATWAALYGSDPSKGAIFYFDTSSTNQWMWSRPVTTTIGKMVYAK